MVSTYYFETIHSPDELSGAGLGEQPAHLRPENSPFKRRARERTGTDPEARRNQPMKSMDVMKI